MRIRLRPLPVHPVRHVRLHELGEPTLDYTPVSEYLVWQNGASRTQPLGYFGQSGSADASAGNQSFRTWFAGCASGPCSPIGWVDVAEAQDPEFACRQHNVVLITDGTDTCGSVAPCAVASTLRLQDGVRTFVVAYGVETPASPALECIAVNGGTVSPVFPRNPGELAQALRDIFVAAGQP